MAQPTANQPKVVLVVDDELDLLEVFNAVRVEEADLRVLTVAVPDLVAP